MVFYNFIHSMLSISIYKVVTNLYYFIYKQTVMPKTKQPKGGASVGGATTAPAVDMHLETNADADDNTILDAFVEKLLTVQQHAYQACLQSAVTETNVINNELKQLGLWFRANKVSLNVNKTNVIVFNNKNKLEQICI